MYPGLEELIWTRQRSRIDSNGRHAQKVKVGTG